MLLDHFNSFCRLSTSGSLYTNFPELLLCDIFQTAFSCFNTKEKYCNSGKDKWNSSYQCCSRDRWRRYCYHYKRYDKNTAEFGKSRDEATSAGTYHRRIDLRCVS
mgnify:CR=1 FL=1